MTATLGTDPTVVEVALGARSYDIVIGRGVIDSLGARIAALRPGAKAFIVTDDNVARYAVGERRSGAGQSRRSGAPRDRASRGSLEKLCRIRASLRGDRRVADGARRSYHRARRRRRRRSCRFRRGGGAARARLCASADHAIGASRFLGRRQDRDRFRTWQKSHRRLPSADSGAGRYRAPRYPAGSGIPRRLCGGRQIRPARRCRFLRLARSQLA